MNKQNLKNSHNLEIKLKREHKMHKTHKEKWEALDRLIKNAPKRVSKGSNINLDTVALEAGFGRGSIKRGRQGNRELVHAIDTASHKQKSSHRKFQLRLDKHAANEAKYKDLYHKGLNIQLMLINRIHNLEKGHE